MREKVEAQELKLRKLRALRGQADNANKTNNNHNNASLTNDLESIRRLFNEKEKELAMAVTKGSPFVNPSAGTVEVPKVIWYRTICDGTGT